MQVYKDVVINVLLDQLPAAPSIEGVVQPQETGSGVYPPPPS